MPKTTGCDLRSSRRRRFSPLQNSSLEQPPPPHRRRRRDRRRRGRDRVIASNQDRSARALWSVRPITSFSTITACFSNLRVCKYKSPSASRINQPEMGKMVVAIVVSLWVIPISIMVNTIVPEPYMDEIFHIPQAQRYCRGDFKTWDPMITTPPGQYYLTLAYVASWFPGMWASNAVSSVSELCSTSILRSANGLLAVICSILVYDLLIQLRPTLGERKATLYSIILALYPVNWFFTFLYYTDVASLTVVLAMYLASLRKQYWVSALLGALATILRQTNVIWMLFVTAIGAIRYAEDICRKACAGSDELGEVIGENSTVTKGVTTQGGPTLRRRTMSSTSKAKDRSIYDTYKCSSYRNPGFLEELMDILFKLWYLKLDILISFSPFILVSVGFVTFVIRNGSIVLGAKEAHVVSPHFAQMLYFALVSTAAFAPVHFNLGQAASLCRSFRRKKFLSTFSIFIALLSGFLFVCFFSIAHPYLLADNRHYPFYIWRKVIQAHWTMKYLIVPLYVYSWFSIIDILGRVQKKFWIVLFVAACGLVLIPAPLIEFRYYTIPIYFLILHSDINNDFVWLTTGALYVALNIFTMTMFLFRPFTWSHEPGIQRFIW